MGAHFHLKLSDNVGHLTMPFIIKWFNKVVVVVVVVDYVCSYLHASTKIAADLKSACDYLLNNVKNSSQIAQKACRNTR